MRYEVHLSAECMGAMVLSYLREHGFPIEEKAIRLSMDIEDPLETDRLYTVPIDGIDVSVSPLSDEEKAIAPES